MKKILTSEAYRKTCDLSLFPHFVFPENCQVVTVFRDILHTTCIIDDRTKRFVFAKDAIMKRLILKAEKEKDGRLFKFYVEMIELCCR